MRKVWEVGVFFQMAAFKTGLVKCRKSIFLDQDELEEFIYCFDHDGINVGISGVFRMDYSYFGQVWVYFCLTYHFDQTNCKKKISCGDFDDAFYLLSWVGNFELFFLDIRSDYYLVPDHTAKSHWSEQILKQRLTRFAWNIDLKKDSSLFSLSNLSVENLRTSPFTYYSTIWNFNYLLSSVLWSSFKCF